MISINHFQSSRLFKRIKRIFIQKSLNYMYTMLKSFQHYFLFKFNVFI